jgi:hypothetical protein
MTLDELALATAPASRARDALVQLLADAGVEAAADAGAFFPQPVGVLVGLPTMTGRTLGARRFTIPVLVVSGDPLSSPLAVDRLYALADDVALALSESSYRPSTWRSTANAEPLPAVELTSTVTVPESEA